MSILLAALVLVDDEASPTNVVIPIEAQQKEVLRSMTHLTQLRMWLHSHIEDGLPYQEILAELDAVQSQNAPLRIRIERAD